MYIWIKSCLQTSVKSETKPARHGQYQTELSDQNLNGQWAMIWYKCGKKCSVFAGPILFDKCISDSLLAPKDDILELDKEIGNVNTQDLNIMIRAKDLMIIVDSGEARSWKGKFATQMSMR